MAVAAITLQQQIDELMTRRDELHNEMVLSPKRENSTWFMDRTRQIGTLNRQLDRLHVRAAVAG